MLVEMDESNKEAKMVSFPEDIYRIQGVSLLLKQSDWHKSRILNDTTMMITFIERWKDNIL